MKKTLLLIAMMLCCAMTIFAQNNKISYQAVVRDTENKLVANKMVNVTVTITDADNHSYTQEFTDVQTNLNGLISLMIGPDGENAAWNSIHWNHANVVTTVTLAGVEVGTLEMPLTAVPYAFYADYADYADSLNVNVIANYLTSHNIPDGAGVNVQSDWKQTDTQADDYIKNKPNIRDSINTYLTDNHYIDQTALDSRHYLTSDSTVITDLQLNVTTLQSDVTTLQTNVTNLRNGITKEALCDSVNTCVNNMIDDKLAGYTTTSELQNTYATKVKVKQDSIALGALIDVKANTASVYTKTESDNRYLQSYTETDPTVKDSLVTITVNSNVTAGSFTLNQNSNATINIVEADPTVPAWAKSPNPPAGSGTLNTNNTNALDVNSSEALSGEVKLHKVSKTGSYNDLNNKPDIKDSIGGYLDTCTVVTNMQTDINGLQMNVTKLQNGTKKAALCDSVSECVNSSITSSLNTALSNYATKAKVKQDSIDICALIATSSTSSTGSGTLNTNNSNALDVNGSEALSGEVKLHKISKTGSYGDLNNRPSIKDSIGDFLSENKYINNADCETVNLCTLAEQLAALRTDMRKSIDSLKKTIDTLKNVIDSLEGVINDLSGDIPPTTDVPDGAIDGRFTINGDQAKVYFSQGNLQATYDGSAWSWAFADNQYDYIGNAEGNTKVTDSSPFVSGYSGSSTTVDLFGWVGASSNWNTNTGVNMYGITSSTATANKDGYGNQRDDALNSDWGTLAITNGGNTANSGWRTLTYDEWEWILGPSSNPNPGTNCRTSSTVGGTENARYAKATVDGKAGLIIFPDSYTHPSDVTAPTSININASTVAFTVNTYDATAWEKMEEAGAVFLPDAGYRNGATVSYAGGRGGYWTSSPYNKSTVIGSNDNKKAYYLSISSKNNANDVKLNNNDRYIGYSVRLVKGANN